MLGAVVVDGGVHELDQGPDHRQCAAGWQDRDVDTERSGLAVELDDGLGDGRRCISSRRLIAVGPPAPTSTTSMRARAGLRASESSSATT